MEEYTRGYNACNRKWIANIKDKIEEYKERKAKCNDIKSEIRLDVKIKAYEELLESEE